MTVGAGFAATVAAGIVFMTAVVLSNTESFNQVAYHLKYVAVLILIRVISIVFLQIFRGDQLTSVFNVFIIANRYLAILSSVMLIIYVYKSVKGVFVGTIYVEALVAVLGLVYLIRRRRIGNVQLSLGQMQRALKFGVPLVVSDFLVSLVSSSDRFVIQYFLGSSAVAVYSVAYDISDYVAVMFASPLQLAILPIVYSLWSKEGQEATRTFVSKAVNLSFVIVIPMIAGFSVVGPDIVTILASEKYVDSGELVPIIALGVMLGSVNFLFYTGLLLQEKTVLVTILNTVAAVMNIVLNVLWIPRYGIIGAAYATVLTYIMLNVLTYRISGRYFELHIEWMLLLKAVLSAGGMIAAILYIGDLTGSAIINVLIKAGSGAVLYVCTMLFIDPRTRQRVNEICGRYPEGKSNS
jgi:O-antigen/teichoic acid export membrane protein